MLIKPERKQRIPLPHYLLINGQMLGLMRGNDNVRVTLPQGDYAVTVRSAYKFIESTAQVYIAEGETLTLTFGDRERWWNWLFNIDLVLWLIKWFFDLATTGTPSMRLPATASSSFGSCVSGSSASTISG